MTWQTQYTNLKEQYYFSHSTAHFYDEGEWSELFELIDDYDFLAEQADFFNGFQECSATVESQAIPAAIKNQDWARFVRYSVVGLNLRGLAEELAQPEILQALAQSGRLDLAQDLAAQLSDPLRKAMARSILAHADRDRDPAAFRTEIQELQSDLDSVPAPSDDREAGQLAHCLQRIASKLAPDLQAGWARWIGMLRDWPRQALLVQQAIAQCWAQRQGFESPQFWKAVEQINSPHALTSFLPPILSAAPLESLPSMLKRVQRLPSGDEELFWLTCLAVLSKAAKAQPEQAVQSWQEISRRKEVPWSEEIVQAGCPLWLRFTPENLDRQIGRLTDANLRAAFRVVLLEEASENEECPQAHRLAALGALEEMSPGPGQLHWSLRYLTAVAKGSKTLPDLAEECRQQLGLLATHLGKLRFNASAKDLALFLDLISALTGDELHRYSEDIVWAPSANPDTLLEIAQQSRSEKLLAHLLEHAEDHAAAVAPTEAEAFRLRGRLVSRLTRRLCSLREDLHFLESASRLLLPEEQDEVRATLANSLVHRGQRFAEPDDPQREMAWQAAQGISKGSLKLVTLLRVHPGNVPTEELLEPSRLYSSVASAQAIEDEMLALTALLEPPLDGAGLAERYIRPISSQQRRNMALMRLTRHLNAFQALAFPEHQDRLAAIELVRSTLTVGTDDFLARLTPQIAALGTQAGPRRAAAEFQEAARRLAGLETVPWEMRRETLEELLDQFRRACNAGGNESPHRLAVPVLESILHLILTGGSVSLGGKKDWRFLEILPALVATAERLPDLTAKHLMPRPRLWRTLRTADACRSIQDWLRRRIKECIHVPPTDSPAANPSKALGLCLADSAERHRLKEQLLAQSKPDPSEVEALAYLLAPFQPGSIPKLVVCLPVGSNRDRLCLRLIRHQWLPRPASKELIQCMQALDARLIARIWQGLLPESEPRAWISSMAQAMEYGLLAPQEPHWQPALNRLWQMEGRSTASILAGAVLKAIAQRGRPAGESAFRLWLHFYLSPRLGEEQPDKLALGEQVRQEIERALSLFEATDSWAEAQGEEMSS